MTPLRKGLEWARLFLAKGNHVDWKQRNMYVDLGRNVLDLRGPLLAGLQLRGCEDRSHKSVQVFGL
jgi:hypothetical protein